MLGYWTFCGHCLDKITQLLFLQKPKTNNTKKVFFKFGRWESTRNVVSSEKNHFIYVPFLLQRQVLVIKKVY